MQQEEAFTKARKSLEAATTLSFLSPNVPIFLSTDASSITVGAIFDNCRCSMRPLVFFSRKLSTGEGNYSTCDCELLSIYLAVQHFWHHLEGNHFAININQTETPPLSSAIMEYSCIIQHIPGMKNPIGSALLRVEIDTVHLGLDYELLIGTRRKDPETPTYRTAITYLWWHDVLCNQEGDTSLWDVSTSCPCPSSQWPFADASGCWTAKLIKQVFIRHGMRGDTRH